MTTLATVVSLIGQAWAENANGERRVLEVGDQLAIDETLVLERGARVNLDFGDNQQLTFLGEQQVTAEERANLVEQSESLAPLEPNDQPITDPSTQSNQGTFSEGHGFVQLVRIGEIIEADGFTPVTVARIQEVLRPLGLSLPQRELEKGFRDEHLANRNDEYLDDVDPSGGNNDQPGESGQEPGDGGEQPGEGEQPGDGDQPDDGDEEPGDGGDRPELSISIDVIADDDIISAAEAEQPVTLTGTVGGDAQPGDKVTITVNGKAYETTVNADGKTWQTEVPGSELVQDRTVEATITSGYFEGEPVTAEAERPYLVEVTKPVLSIELEGAGPGGIYSESEISNGKVPAKVTLDKDTVKVGDLLQVKTPNGGVLLERPVTQEDIDNGVRVQVPVSPGQGKVTVEASITDPVGNSSTDRDEKPIDTLPPLLTGALDPQNDQDADPINLDISGKFSDAFSGSNLIYSAANLPGGLTIDPGTGVISGRIHSSASQTGNVGNGEYEVTITVFDPAGNSTQHSFTWTVTNPAPTAADDSGSTDEDTTLVVNPRNGVLKNDVDPDGDQLFVTGIVAGGSKPTSVGGLDTDIIGDYGTLKLQADGSYTYVPDKTNPDVRALKDGETLEDIFSYTMTDREGGADDATLVITINGVSDSEPTIIPKDENGPDDPNDIITAGHATVYESGLIADTPTQSKTVEGEITVTALDGLISVKVHGQTFDLTQLADLENTAVVLDTDYGKLTLNGFTPDEVDSTIVGGELSYSYELDIRFDNAAPGSNGDLNGFDSIDLEVLDAGNTSKNGTLEINIIDDEPAVSEKTVTHSVEVDETTLGVPSTAVSFADAFDTAYGADGAASSNGLVYSFEIDTTLATGLIDTATGENIELTISATGEAEGRTESGDLAFTVRVDSTNGEVTLTQARALKHPDKANPDDAVSLVENTLKLKATATDGDGDENSASISLGDKLVFKDDGPAVEVEAGFTAPEVIVDETSLGTPSSAIAFAGAFVAPDSGEDGAASTDALVYSLDIDPAIVTGLTDTATGQAIVLSINSSGEVEGRTDTDGELAFTASVDSNTGKVTLTQSRALSHPDTSDHDDAVSLAENALSLKATATDGDGDEASASISLGDKLVFKDDGPAIEVEAGFTAPEVIVDETSLGTPSDAKAFAGAFKAPDYGADGAASSDALVYSLDIDSTTSTGLIDTATGQAIVLSINGSGEVEGRTDVGGNLAFTISVNSDGEVTLTQSRSMQHTDTDDPDDEVTIASGTIKLHATALDGDGDTDKSDGVDIGGQFTFKDDGPTIDGSEVGGDGYVSDNAIVDERYLASGSESDPSKLIVGKNLPIDFGADGAVNAVGDIGLTFNSNIQDLIDLGLKSGTTDLTYAPSTDGHTITATAGANDIFTIELKVAADGTPSYEFTLQGPLDHTLDAGGATAENIVLPFDIKATDGDGDSVDLKFKVEVIDDTPPSDTRELEVNEDDSVSFSNADINQTTTTVITDAEHGTVTIGNDGTITYMPNEDYRGSDSYTYKVVTDGGEYERTVNITVKPVADAPLFTDRTDDGVVETPEDTEKSLELKLPAIKDTGATDQKDVGYAGSDYSELVGAITLEVKDVDTTVVGAGVAQDVVLQTVISGATKELKPATDGKITIVITDQTDFHVSNIQALHPEGTANGVYHLTKDQYEAITAHPAEDRHENFEVEVSVKSYEVDASGEALPDADVGGTNGAESTQTITVDVHAVTDDVGLKVQDDDTQAGVTVVISDADKTADITFDEDTSFNLTNILAPEAFKDTDGSETRYLGLKGLPDGTTVTVGGDDYVIGGNAPTVNFGGTIGEIPALTLAGTETNLPDITITPPKDLSGDLPAFEVILGALDSDSDSASNPGFVPPVVETDSVTIKLHIKPVGGDVAIEGAEGDEDTAIKFLENIKVTDDSTAIGTLGEVITEVSFTVPAGWTADGSDNWTNAEGQTWTMTEPVASTDWSGAWVGNTYTITFDTSPTGITKEARENILKEFTVTPPAHSSKDIDLSVEVTSVDHSIISGGSSSDPASKIETLTVVVKPVAELEDTDSDSADGNDVTMVGDHVYQTTGEEDGWFALGDETSTSFKLSAGWSNEDGKWVDDGSGNWFVDTSNGRSEDTFALLTPYMTVNNDARPGAATAGTLDGSVFTYEGPGGTVTLPFAGEPVKIPMQYLDTVQFKGPADWSGVVKIKVQAGTVDYDEDDNAATDLEASGESWLTNLIIEPRADQVTLKVDAIIKTPEDTPVALNINPTSSGLDETFNVTIDKIPVGATVDYWYFNESGTSTQGTFTGSAGNTSVEIINFDKANQPTLTPPKDSNVTINLDITAQSVDTLTYIDSGGTEQTITDTDPSKNQTLPTEVQVQGVPDDPILGLVQDKVYAEDAGDQNTGQLKVALSDLITELKSGETGVGGAGPDGSETVTLRISNLPEGFNLENAGPALGGSGESRVWVITEAHLATVEITVPKHYSGTVKFTAQPVVTENDNPSEIFFAPQNVSFDITPVPEATLSISSNLIEDTIGELELMPVGDDSDEYISTVRIKVSDVTDKELTLFTNSDGTGTPATETISGDEYYVFNVAAGQEAPNVYVKGPANFSGEKTLNIEYEVTDPVTSGIGSAVAEWKAAITHTLNFAAATDEIDLTLGDITGGTTDAGVTTAQKGDTVTVGLKITQKADTNAGGAQDADGSEKFIHVVISDVPAGVSVNGAIETAPGEWLMTVGSEAFNAAELTHNLEFVVSGYANTFQEAITITTYTQDTGAETIEEDSIQWTLNYVSDTGPDPVDLPELTLTAIDTPQTEDVSFVLGSVVTGAVSSGSTTDPFDLTVTIRTTPDDETAFAGMTRTLVTESGQQVALWTATVSGVTQGSAQTALDNLLGGITVTSPQDANSNNIAGGTLDLDINVSAHAHGISRDAQATPKLPITPVTDDLVITVSESVVDEGENIDLTISLSSENGADGTLGAPDTGWIVVDDTVFIHIADGLDGELYVNGIENLGSVTAPTGAPALSDGKYYEVSVADLDKLQFRPDAGSPHQTGSLGVTVWAEHQENSSGGSKVSEGTGSLTIQQSNNGYEATITAAGEEAQTGGDKEKAIELNFGADAGLVDPAEEVSSAYISGLPSGFTVYAGPDATNATMANNAGNETWVVPVTGGALPTYIAILPPANWSGGLTGLNLTVLSGHAGLAPTPTELPIAFEVTPVASGITLSPTLSFGDAGELIALNLNASMKDPIAATGAIGDTHTERTELKLTGFPGGEKVQFFIGPEVGDGTLDGRVAYDSGSNEYTIRDLTQTELDSLQFVHGTTSGAEQVGIVAKTYEVDGSGNQVSGFSDEVTSTVNINVSPVVATSGADKFLWEGTAINGFGGEDTVQLRFGDDLGSGDFSKLENIEIIDMKDSGANKVGEGAGLSIQDVLDMTDENNALKIDGDGDDSIFLKNSEWTNAGSDGNGHTVYTDATSGASLSISEQITSITMVD
ncbi:DUF5801 repeats-in-toxin domain-containing protein [Marinobacter sp. S6332]|uniref:DUF5801 repeats-in-toxin domain-containing protein n=1 Tax=Marinobacter sp. S6332 TaxID=2926403 RepID=UPI001FF200BE|nr:DUF5801 repeats-in-toxin domain-containing protein [Marinobacter sp. S6332]MCK0163921.1 DUF5801 domain-containing protein [Marinobacter sp. S6332]